MLLTGNTFRGLRSLNRLPWASLLQAGGSFPVSSRSLAVSSVCLKVRKGGGGDKKKTPHHGHHHGNLHSISHSESQILKLAAAEMADLEKILHEELGRHFSAKVDLRVYEDIKVVLDNGEEQPMNRLGRITLKSPQMVLINFADNPTAIKAAKLAIQKSSLGVTPQHEGIMLYVPVPRMTRERRQALAHAAKTTILNDFKAAINKVYVKYDKRSSKESKTPDEAVAIRNALLTSKRASETVGTEYVVVQQKELMKEVA